MLSIYGRVQRLFDFPANPEEAFSFFLNFERVIAALPKIEFVAWHPQEKRPNACRVRYRSTEMGVYSVNIYCDLSTETKPKDRVLYVNPLVEQVPPVETSVSWYSLTGFGTFSSVSKFLPELEHSVIDYSLSLKADLPIPLALKFVPRPVLEGIAASIVNHRIQEIADGFMKRCVQTYQSLILEC